MKRLYKTPKVKVSFLPSYAHIIATSPEIFEEETTDEQLVGKDYGWYDED